MNKLDINMMSQAPSLLSLDLTDVAPYSAECYEPRDRFLDIDIGVYDYVLKCIEGPFQGKFIYLNTSPMGEIIGGTDDYDIHTNPERLTMYIENAELAKRHVEIVFNSHCQYVLKNNAGGSSKNINDLSEEEKG